MRSILLTLGIIGSLSVAAQDNNMVEDYFKKNVPKLKKDVSLSFPAAVDLAKKMPMGMEYSHSLASGTKVYTLPQDNMPCVVPDMNQFNMPNAGTGIKIKPHSPGAIPNPGAGNNNNVPRGQVMLFPKKSR
jgi:hypothetical protein